MFGQDAKLACIRDPPKIENEGEILVELRQRLGPYASESRLLFHIRSARGKLHWSINSYFREVMIIARENGVEDFQAPPPAAGATASSLAYAGASPAMPSSPSAAPLAAPAAPSAAPLAAPAAPLAAPAPAQAHPTAATACSSNSRRPAGAAAAGEGAGPGNSGGAPARSQEPTALGTEALPSTLPTADSAPSPSPSAPSAAAVPASSAAPAAPFLGAGAASSDGSMDALPEGILVEICSHLPVSSLCAAAQVSRALRKAAASEAIWESLFKQRWGATNFPTDPHLATSAAAVHQHQYLAQHPALLPETQDSLLPNDWLIDRHHHRLGLPSPLPGLSSGAGSSYTVASFGQQQQQQQQQGLTTSLLPPPAPPHAPSQAHSAAARAAAAADVGGSGAAAGPDPAPAAADGGATAGTACASAPAAAAAAGSAPSGSWRGRFARQSAFCLSMWCPRCGAGRVVPVVYGFPSPQLLQGMRSRRLILGGDHLIENCHVWACTHCNSSFRTYPYLQTSLWQQDLELLASKNNVGPGGVGPAYTYEL